MLMSKPAKSTHATNTSALPLVPALRFPEFRNAPGWEKKFLGQAVESVTTGKLDANAMVENGKYRFYTCAKNYYFIDDYAFDTEALLVAGNGAYLGYIHYYKGKFNAYQRTYVLSGFKAHVTYLKFFLDKNLPERIRAEKKDGNTPYIVMSTLTDMPIMLPQKAEQQKIADCLSSLDELIVAEASKVEALKAHKKGLMQQLFPAEGQTIPALRFPEFRNAPEWEAKKLGELSEIVRGGSPRPIDQYLTSANDGLNWLKIGDVDKEAKYVTATQEKVIFAALSKTREVNPGDLILSNSMSFGRPYILKIKTCIHDGWIAVTHISNEVSRDYIFYFMLSPESQDYFSANAAGSGVQNLNADIIKLLLVIYPKKEEQQKIADCLSSLDELIAAEASKVEALKAHKKGLMQQLFPTIHEDAA